MVEIRDTAIFAVNVGKRENEESSLMYRKGGKTHKISFEVCARNRGSETCIGLRNDTEGWFLLDTTGIQTKITFRRGRVTNLLGYHRLTGNREARFQQLQKLMEESGYTTSSDQCDGAQDST